MTVDETTQLLAKPASGLTGHSKHHNGRPTGTAPISRTFAVWQIGALFGILLAYGDTSLVWATHETVASHFDSRKNASWMMTSFTIGYCVTLPLYGRLSDIHGRLRPLVAAYVIFSIGCALCGVGQAYWQVIFGRILTGFGASGIISLASIIITDIASPSNVAVLRSYVNVASTVGLSLGGPVGGLLGGTIGWRWSFLGQVPIAVICCLLTARGVVLSTPTVTGDIERQREDGKRQTNTLAFDFPGAITLAIGVSSLLTVIDIQNRLSWAHPLVLSLTIVGISSIVGFLVLETYPGNRELLIPMKLLRTEIGAFCAGQILLVGSCHGFMAQIAPYFANTQGASDAASGARTIPASIGNAAGNLIAGQLIKRFSGYKKLSLINLALSISTAIWILLRWSHHISTWEAAATLPLGLFDGIVLAAQFFGLYLCAPKEQMATAISMYYMSQQLGVAIGISLSSSLLKQQFHTILNKTLVDVPGYNEIIKSILTDSTIVAQLPAELKSLVWRGYLKSFWVLPAQVLAAIPMALTTESQSD